jgi:putative hydrolase of the HAD superfamily
MKRAIPITALFPDIGGVLLTNGWDRHCLTFDTYEEAKLTLDEYLGRMVFCQKRPFSRAQFRHFMFAPSNPYPEIIKSVRTLKEKYGLKTAVGIQSILHMDSRSMCERLTSFGLQ